MFMLDSTCLSLQTSLLSLGLPIPVPVSIPFRPHAHSPLLVLRLRTLHPSRFISPRCCGRHCICLVLLLIKVLVLVLLDCVNLCDVCGIAAKFVRPHLHGLRPRERS